MENDGKLRLLYLWQILFRMTNEEHPLSTVQLMDILKGKYGVSSHRTTIASDIEALQRFGMDICKIESTQNKYFVASRRFQLPELRLLMDSVDSSGTVTEKKSRLLLEKLGSLTDVYSEQEMINGRSLHRTEKPDNEMVYYIIDKIDTAIQRKKKISFYYYEYDGAKNRRLKNDGEPYVVSPYSLGIDGERYYVVGFSEKHGNIGSFRVERIAGVPTLLEEDADPVPAGFEVSSHIKASFRMFFGDERKVSLLCDESMMNTVIDHFGSDIEVSEVKKGQFTTQVDVVISPMFFRWVFCFEGKIKIQGPEDVRQTYREMLMKALDNL